MKSIVYDLFMFAGYGLLVAGVAVSFGTGPALMVSGGGLMALTYLAAH